MLTLSGTSRAEARPLRFSCARTRYSAVPKENLRPVRGALNSGSSGRSVKVASAAKSSSGGRSAPSEASCAEVKTPRVWRHALEKYGRSTNRRSTSSRRARHRQCDCATSPKECGMNRQPSTTTRLRSVPASPVLPEHELDRALLLD
jgi:hypothetical protein